MININLLPWRENLRIKRQRKFLQQTALIFSVSILVIVFWHMLILAKESKLDCEIRSLEYKLNQLNIKVAQVARLKQHQQQLFIAVNNFKKLQNRQLWPVRFLTALSRLVVSGIQLTAIKMQGCIDIEGKAISYTAIAKFMNSLDHTKLLKQLKLQETKNNSGRFIDFSLQGTFKNV